MATRILREGPDRARGASGDRVGDVVDIVLEELGDHVALGLQETLEPLAGPAQDPGRGRFGRQDPVEPRRADLGQVVVPLFPPAFVDPVQPQESGLFLFGGFEVRQDVVEDPEAEPVPLLQAADHGLVVAGLFGQLVLRQPGSLAQRTHLEAEPLARLGVVR
jgi:hypothetical protein